MAPTPAKNLRYIAKKQAMVDAIRRKPCDDCGGSYPVEAMDLHHVDPSLKTDTLSRMVKTRGISALRTELQNVVPLCANCHRVRSRADERRRHKLD